MDKLTVLNNALINTGNNRVNTLYEGSDEYLVADTAFDAAIKLLSSIHTWPFATTMEKLVRAPDSENKSRTFPDHCFRIPPPPQVLHVKEIYYRSVLLVDYEIMGFTLSCRHADEIYAKVVREAPGAIWHPMAEQILTLRVEAGILRGLNEDFKEADSRERRADDWLVMARPHLDQQNPARNMYRSKISAARRTRRV